VQVGEQQAVQSIRAVASVWPSTGAHTDSHTATLRRSRKADRTQTWVLVASAFVLGLVLGAAAFVGVWRTTASQSDRATAARAVADRRLSDSNARSASLSRQLHRAKGDLHTTLRQEQHLKVELRRAVHQAALAGRQSASDRTTLLTLRHRASTVTSYVASLDAYVKATPSQDLDSAFLSSQLVYLSAAAHRLQTP
jgi:hypothetical protein